MSKGHSTTTTNQAVSQNTNESQQQQQQQAQGQAQSQAQSATSTPNNLPLLMQAWGLTSNLTNGTNGSSIPIANSGIQQTAAGADAAANAATGGLNAATGIANGGAVNGANGYLTPFANGSMSGDNPYFKNLVDQITRSVQQSTDGDFAASGRYGSGANANAFNGAVANEAGQLGYQNYSDSLNRQLQGAQQLSTNNTNSTNAALAALGLIPQLGTAATGAGAAKYAAGVAPTLTMAQILQMLGEGGGTQSGTATGNALGFGTGAASGTAQGTMTGTENGTSSTSKSGFDLGSIFSPISLFSGGLFKGV